VANRFHAVVDNDNKEQSSSITDRSSSDLAQAVMTTTENQLLKEVIDPIQGPFAEVWQNDLQHWDGIRDAQEFWKAVPSVAAECWHHQTLLRPPPIIEID
jgi:hypothetical protein